MTAVVVERGPSLWVAGKARIIKSTADVDHAELFKDFQIEQSNPYLKWIAGDFVEADNPNSNKQYWEHDELAMSEYSIKYAPLNMIHKTKQPIGFFLATNSVDLTGADASSAWDLPTDDEIKEALKTEWAKTPSGANAPYKIKEEDGKYAVYNNAGMRKASFDTRKKALAYQRALYANVPGAGTRANKVAYTGKAKDRVKDAAAEASGSMKIQALSGMWSHVFPFEAALIDQADELDALYYSMECRGTHLHCAGEDGCGEIFDYLAADDHCEHIKERSSIRHIVNPTFRGGAMIVPPVRPGWSGASASVYQEAVMQEAAFLAEQTEKQYQAANGVISSVDWEHLMSSIVMLSGLSDS